MRPLLVLLIVFGAYSATAQIKITGIIKDKAGAGIAAANILVLQDSSGAVSDENGSFTLNFKKKGNYTLKITHIQFDDKLIQLAVKSDDDEILQIILAERQEVLEELEVVGKEPTVIAVSRVRINTENLQMAPVPFQDISSILATLPSVTSNNELSSAYSVRGGSYDENLVLVNGIPVYRPFLVRSGEQEGLSFINTDLVSSVDFSAGGWTVEYDDKMSSVLAANYKRPKDFAGSAMVSLLGAKAHVEGKIGEKVSYLAGVRHRRSAYLLNTLSVEGEYKPVFTDFQTFWNFKVSDKTSIEALLSYANNSYSIVPSASETSFGTFNQELRLEVAFDGQQQMKYQTYQAAVKLNHEFSPKLKWTTIISAANYSERENIDLEGGYRLCDVDKNIGSDQFNECISIRGIGTLFNYSRNRLSAVLIDAESNLNYTINSSQSISGGVAYSKQLFDDYINEYELIDSAGYIAIESSILGENSTDANLIKGFIQHSINLQQWSWVYGLRINHNTLNSKTLVSPRLLASFHPAANQRLNLKFGVGIYQQQPFYKEFRSTDGTIKTDLDGQSSIHFNLGMEYSLDWWGRPFVFTSEVYYKYLWNQVPYIIDNVRQQYFPEYTAIAKSIGFEARLGGEFIPGTESWFSLSVMSAQEKIPGVDEGFIRRPTDQRFKLAFLFEDHVPGDPSLRVNLLFQYGSGLPVGPPNSLEQRNSFSGDDYTRLDIGFSKIFDFNDRFFKFLRLGLEINNLLGSRNAVSYTWIKDVNDQQFAVPNYLTGRLFNVVVSTGF
jgi:CarboxypepD_reg-like domain/TonB dependent receptor-like, beta-barrel/TonB-dependent Receptor Plug Domain